MRASDNKSITLAGAVLLSAMAASCIERSSPGKPLIASNDSQAARVGTQSPPPSRLPASVTEWVSWTVADTGFGPITFGMTPEQANAVVGGALELPEGMTPDACDYAFPRGVDSLALMIEQGKVVRVEVTRHDIRTVEGAGVGDTEARIQQLYPGRIRVSPHRYTDGHYLTVVRSDTTTHPYRLIFETDGAVVTTFRGGALPQVAYIEGCS